MSMKIVFISCLFGEGGSYPSVFSRNVNYDYFLFSDKDQSDFDTSWEVINVKNHSIINGIDCNIRKSRYYKFLAWRELSHYDFIFYCDAHLSPNPEFNWENYVKSVNKFAFKLCQDKHVLKITEECGILADLILIVGYNRDSFDRILKTVDFFRKNFPNVPLEGGSYYQNTFIGYNPNCKNVCNFLNDFWLIYTNSDITFRDQPLWNVLLRNKNLSPFSDSILKLQKFICTGEYGNHFYVKY